MFKKLQLVLLLLCFSLGKPAAQNLFNDFKILEVPRKNVPLGAIWINGIGPNGAGLAKDNIRISNSYSSYSLDKTIKEKFDFSFSKYIADLGISYLRTKKISYSNIIVHTIEDFSKLPISAGENILYEYITIDTIQVEFEDVAGVNMKSDLSGVIPGLVFSNNFRYDKTVKINGNNLIFAYRVVQFSKTKMYEKRFPINEKKLERVSCLRRLKFDQYEVEVIPCDFEKCVYASHSGGLMVNVSDQISKDYQTCSRQLLIKIEIKDLSSLRLDGTSNTYRGNMSNGSTLLFKIPKSSNGIISTDYVDFTIKYGGPQALLGMQVLDYGSFVNLKRIEAKLTTLKNPFAPGW